MRRKFNIKKILIVTAGVIVVSSVLFSFTSPEKILGVALNNKTTETKEVLFSSFRIDESLAQDEEESADPPKDPPKKKAADDAATPSSVELFFMQIAGTVFGWIIALEGFLITLFTGILVTIARYNGFVNAKAVSIGWTLVRDISNLFFVLILLAIAIATILRVESYNFKKLLPKVIIMAVLVNFSRLICGLIIDFAQVIMMTFVNAFRPTIEGDLMVTLGIKSIMQGASDIGRESGIVTVVITGALAVVLLAVALIVIMMILAVLIMRMVMLWILVVLSPLAFVLSAFPQGQKYAQQWWQEFSKYVIIGPVLAFFLYLSFAVIARTNTGAGGNVDISNVLDTTGAESALAEDLSKKFDGTATVGDETAAPFSEIAGGSEMLAFIIGIAMLMGGLMVTQQMGVAGGQLGGQLMARAKKAGAGVLKTPFKWGGALAKMPLGVVGRRVQRAILANKVTRVLTPSYWEGFGTRSKKLVDQEKRAAAGVGEERSEKIFMGKKAARRRGEEAERSIITEYKSDQQKQLGDSGFSRQKFGELATRAFAEGGQSGERQRQAVLEMAAEHGNYDDVYEFMAPKHYEELGMSKEEAKKFSPESFKKFAKGFLWKGDQAAADKFDPEAILKSQVESEGEGSELASAYQKFESTGSMRSLTDGEKGTLNNARKEARKKADKNVEGASDNDKNRLQSLASLSESIKKTGHWEQMMVGINPETGSARFRDTQEHINEVTGESKKLGMRAFLQSFAPHNVRSRIYNEDTEEYEVSHDMADMEAYQLAMFGKDGPFKEQQAGEMRQMQTRIIEQFIGDYFADNGELAELDDPGANDRLQEEAYKFRDLNPVIFDALWQAKFRGGRPDMKLGTEYAHGPTDPDIGMRNKLRAGDSGKAFRAAGQRVDAGGGGPADDDEQADFLEGPKDLSYEEVSRYHATFNKVREYDEKDQNFFRSDEYEVGKNDIYGDNYFDEDQFKEYQRQDELNLMPMALSIASFARSSDEDLASGQSRIAVDFDRLGLDFLDRSAKGVTFNKLTGAQGKQVSERMTEVLDEEIANLEEQIRNKSRDEVTEGDRATLENYRKARERFADPKQIGGATAIVNTGGGKVAIAHERTHAFLDAADSSGEMQKEIWQNLGTSKQEQYKQHMKETTGSEMSDDELSREYVTRALVNETRWGDKSDDAERLAVEDLRKVKAQAASSEVSIPYKLENIGGDEEIIGNIEALKRRIKTARDASKDTKPGITDSTRESASQLMSQLMSDLEEQISDLGPSSTKAKEAQDLTRLHGTNKPLRIYSADEQQLRARNTEITNKLREMGKNKSGLPEYQELLKERRANAAKLDANDPVKRAKKLHTQAVDEYQAMPSTKLRERQKELTKQKSKLTRAGRKDSPEYQAIQEEWRTNADRLNEIQSGKAAPGPMSLQQALAAAMRSMKLQGPGLEQAVREGFDNDQIIQGLAGIESVISGLGTSLGQAPSGAVDSKSNAALQKAIGQLKANQSSVKEGGTLDPASTSGLLASINRHLKKISGDAGKNAKKMPNNIPKDKA